MTTVVRVRPATPATQEVPVPRQVTLSLGELVLAARLAGDVPLPLRTDGAPGPDDRMVERLDGRGDDPGPVPDSRAAQRMVAAELRRADDTGPGGARARLGELGVLDGDELDSGLAGALHVLAGGALSLVLDVAARRRVGEVRLRAWFGVTSGLVTRLTLRDLTDLDVAWYDPRRWVGELTRAVDLDPWVPEAAPLVLPDHVSLPSELLAGATKAARDQRPDLLPAMAAGHVGNVRMGDARGVRPADTEEVVALLRTLTTCRGRLRLLTTRRDRREDPGVASWLLLDDGWHELRPGRAATSVLRRRDARDLGLLTLPLVEGVQ
ncbi:hypothetical protein [Nocardioides coralli]|uniref:hypothetical protein n=1 Tax=Nocardioides coralli TaxID=2872154 RepID=UPI001CA42A20|nr:hypothetical protein [Nocardioides coralli]QZY29423.1 hypothetical protein K6T13_01575 [Nocardioides coralli]